MPLPVERSAGSVSSLVARFQTAANRDQASQAREQENVTRRQSFAASRRNSGLSSTSASATEEVKVEGSARNSQSNGAKGEGEGEGEEGAGAVAGGMEVLKDLAGEIKEKLRLKDSKTKPEDGETKRAESKVPPKSDGSSGLDNKKVNDKAAVPKSPRTTKASTQPPKSPITTTNAPKTSIVKPGPSAPAPKSPSSTKASDKSTPPASTSTTRVPSKTTTNSLKKDPSVSPKHSRIPTDSNNGSHRSAITTSTQSPMKSTTVSGSAAGSSNEVSKGIPRKVGGESSSNKDKMSQPSSISTPLPKPPLKGGSKPPPTSFNRTTKLTPSHTGPAKTLIKSSNGSQDTGPSHPSPLKPHLTGTPSKPTASSLAKSRSVSSTLTSPTAPSDKRRSVNLGKSSTAPGLINSPLKPTVASSSVRTPSHSKNSSLSGPPATSTDKLPATPSTGLTKTIPVSSSSRLLQGTAASRARASAPPPIDPTPTKKPSTKSPVKPLILGKSANTATSTSASPVKQSHKQEQEGIPRSAIIGRLGLAAAKEAPKRDVGKADDKKKGSAEASGRIFDDDKVEASSGETQPIEEDTVQEKTRSDVNGLEETNRQKQMDWTNQVTHEGPVKDLSGPKEEQKGVDNLGRVDMDQDNKSSSVIERISETNNGASGEDERDVIPDMDEPEQIRSTSPSPSVANPFGRIGHAGAHIPHEGLSKSNTSNGGSKESNGHQFVSVEPYVQGDSEELIRDPAKTIVSPDPPIGQSQR